MARITWLTVRATQNPLKHPAINPKRRLLAERFNNPIPFIFLQILPPEAPAGHLLCGRAQRAPRPPQAIALWQSQGARRDDLQNEG